MISDKANDIMDNNKTINEIEIKVPTINDAFVDNWDLDCDKKFLIGIYKHGNNIKN